MSDDVSDASRRDRAVGRSTVRRSFDVRPTSTAVKVNDASRSELLTRKR
jgi:hypothetical protein